MFTLLEQPLRQEYGMAASTIHAATLTPVQLPNALMVCVPAQMSFARMTMIHVQ